MAEDDRSASILATSWTLTGLAGLFLGARLLCKLKTKRHLWWDDHVLVLSWVMLLASVIMVTLEVSKGLGKHADRVPSGNIERMRFFGNFTGSFSILAAVWSKTSFAVTLLRLMSARMRIALWAVIASINIFMGLNVVFMWARCRPVSMIWSPSPTGTCWPRQVYPSYAMFAAGYSGAVDFLLALLPWKIIWNLRMKPKEKIAVAVAMSMGVFAGATAIVKTVLVPTIADPNFTYVTAPLVTWGSAESAVTVIAASIPVLRPLFRDVQALTLTRRRYHLSGIGGKGGGGGGGGGGYGPDMDAARYEDLNPMKLSFGPGPVVRATTGGSDSAPLQACGKILQRNEFSVTVEYSNERAGDSSDDFVIQRV